MFSIVPHFYPICFGSFHLYRWAKWEELYTSKLDLLFWGASIVSFFFEWCANQIGSLPKTNWTWEAPHLINRRGEKGNNHIRHSRFLSLYMKGVKHSRFLSLYLKALPSLKILSHKSKRPLAIQIKIFHKWACPQHYIPREYNTLLRMATHKSLAPFVLGRC